MAVRNIGKAKAAAEERSLIQYPGTFEVRELDLMSFDSVREFAAGILADVDHLDVLCNNAGIMMHPKKITRDGNEQQIQTNHFSHFLLTELLLPLLKKSAPSRVVILSSSGHAWMAGPSDGKQVQVIEEGIEIDDINWEERKFCTVKAYQESKLANLLHARGLAKRLENTGVTVVSCHPGYVLTELASVAYPIPLPKPVIDWIVMPLMVFFTGFQYPAQGAETQLHCMLSDEVPRHNGEYFSSAALYKNKALNPGGWPMKSPNSYAHDDDLQERLFALSRRTVGLVAE